MKKKTSTLPWISILVALASAVGIYFLPDYHLWFLAVLLLNLPVSLVFSKRYSKSALTICRLLVGALFIFSSFTKGVDPLGTKYKVLDYLSAYGMTWLNGAAMVLAMLMILAEFLVGICEVASQCRSGSLAVVSVGQGNIVSFITCMRQSGIHAIEEYQHGCY